MKFGSNSVFYALILNKNITEGTFYMNLVDNFKEIRDSF